MTVRQRTQRTFQHDEVVKGSTEESYSCFDRIDGNHSFKDAVPNGYIDYPVRTRHGGSVFFFNFELAKEMGLIHRNHPNEMNSKLAEKILHTFSLVIINEYDVMKQIEYPKEEIRANKYMATRYLQLQHPDKRGTTSGDGRGIWNGEIRHRGTTWDISSSGTGATRLSPAHAQTKQFFKTGDRVVGYGNGYNFLYDGLSAALMSDIFHKNGIETEQTLAIISFEGGSSINIRASKNLFRPAHFFHHLKQANLDGLKSAIDYFINRQVENGDWSNTGRSTHKAVKYQYMAEQMALTFSRIAAQFEAEYVFCWLDWDGDNILANGGIIDYGSIRQFGLYHREYRYDDVDRMSTNVPEQRLKARHIVQNFAQIRDFLVTGRKKNLRRFKKDPILKIFDQNFEKVLHQYLLKKIGMSDVQTDYLMNEAPELVTQLKKHHSYFEKTMSFKGIYKTNDGITADAVFSMRDLHQELPKRLLESADENQLPEPVSAETFLSIMKSSYAKPKDLHLGAYRRDVVSGFQQSYLLMLKKISARFHRGDIKKALREVIMRSSYSNQTDRITGDGILHVTASLIRNQKKLSFEQKLKIIECLVKHQVERIEPRVKPKSKTGKIVLRNLKAIQNHRDGT